MSDSEESHAKRNGALNRWMRLLLLPLTLLAAMSGFWVRGLVDSAPGSPAMSERTATAKPMDLFGVLVEGPKAEFPVVCPVCGGKRDSYATVCAANKVCFSMVRCRKCGILAFLQVDVSGKALVGTGGKADVVDSEQNILRGKEAAAFLKTQGKMGAVLVPTIEGPPRVRAVVPGTPADAAGLKPGDEVLSIGETDCTKPNACSDFSTLFSKQKGPDVTIRVRREHVAIDLVVRR